MKKHDYDCVCDICLAARSFAKTLGDVTPVNVWTSVENVEGGSTNIKDVEVEVGETK